MSRKFGLTPLLLASALLWQSPAALAKKEDAAKAVPSYVRFKPIIVSTVYGPDVTGLLSVAISLSVVDQPAKERIEAQRPKLQDAFNRALFELAYLDIDPRRPVNFKILTTKLQTAADKALPGEKVRVLLTDISSLPQ
jgi:hypothetical protein